MNRIILIGNGFDLAHGLKTSYADFIDWYWGEWGKRLLHGQSKKLEDRFCSFVLKDSLGLGMWYYVWQGYYFKRNNPFVPWDEHEVAKIAKQDLNMCTFTMKSPFFREVCLDVESKGWVDIENVYYNYLSKESSYYMEPKDINDDLDCLRERLVEYLTGVQNNIAKEMVKGELKEKMKAPIKKDDISVGAMAQNSGISYQFEQARMKKYSVSPDRILMLNFNYTTLADLYFPKTSNRMINHIHGKLAEPNSVIFGYGDELDEHYKRILNNKDNEYLRNVKSVKYLEAPNYRHLLEFIESSPYQIFIMGHSCGNSDRTLLNTLFEHRNCVSIKPFYYIKKDGTDNYLELVQNISRNFTDMKLMRDRVVNKTLCETINVH